ncbi:MAG: DNA mismatch repair protein MutS, partial [Oscillospiraceae bacterium]|nr:DNA mismatch repair protein MutS [Oscillospiraceae bacterium]
MELKNIKKEQLSPMMQQYFEVKQNYQDCILFYRLGDFYEMFFDDAIRVSRDLELTLTGRECGLKERAPMCGVPYHSYELYVKKLLELGCKVAICEQMTDPSESKGLVEREVIRVITPGTVFDMLDDASNNYLCSIYCQKDNTALCFADLSTGEASVYAVSGMYQQEEMINLLSRYMPSEILFNQDFLNQKEVNKFLKTRLKCLCNLRDDECFVPELQNKIICQQFSVQAIEELG